MQRVRMHPHGHLRSLTIGGFKAFRDPARMFVRPLTLLAGRNSSGKSSAIQPLLLLKQTAESPFDAGPLRLDGPCLQVDRGESLLWRSPEGVVAPSFWIEMELGPRTLRLEFVREPNGFRLGPTGWRAGGAALDLQPGMLEVQDTVRRAFGLPTGPLTVGANPIGFVHTLETSDGVVVAGPAASEFDASELLYLPGLRGPPSRRYRVTRTGPRFPGPFQDYAASLVAAWQDEGDARLAEVIQDLASLEMGGDLTAERHSDVELELRVARAGGRQTVSLADTGLGLSQVLPVLVALRVARQDQLVHIEQPELHLHPNAQVGLAAVLVHAARRGVRLLVETHSSLLLKAVQVAVSEGEIPASDVGLHWFSQDPAGASRVDFAEMDGIGAYGSWPVDFASVELDIEERFIRASLRGTA